MYGTVCSCVSVLAGRITLPPSHRNLFNWLSRTVEPCYTCNNQQHDILKCKRIWRQACFWQKLSALSYLLLYIRNAQVEKTITPKHYSGTLWHVDAGNVFEIVDPASARGTAPDSALLRCVTCAAFLSSKREKNPQAHLKWKRERNTTKLQGNWRLSLRPQTVALYVEFNLDLGRAMVWG